VAGLGQGVTRCFLGTDGQILGGLLTGNFEDLGAHLNDVDTGLGLLGVLVDHARALGYRCSN